MSARTAVLGLLLLGVANASAADDYLDLIPTLRYDPFQTPAVLDQPPVQASAAQAVPKPPEPWERELRATSISALRSMINVDGVILMLGQELDGFRLVEVREDAAVFEKDGTRRTLTMDEPGLASAERGARD